MKQIGLGHSRGPNPTRPARDFCSELDSGSSPRSYRGVRPHGTIKKRLGALSSLVDSYYGNRPYPPQLVGNRSARSLYIYIYVYKYIIYMYI